MAKEFKHINEFTDYDRQTLFTGFVGSPTSGVWECPECGCGILTTRNNILQCFDHGHYAREADKLTLENTGYKICKMCKIKNHPDRKKCARCGWNFPERTFYKPYPRQDEREAKETPVQEPSPEVDRNSKERDAKG